MAKAFGVTVDLKNFKLKNAVFPALSTALLVALLAIVALSSRFLLQQRALMFHIEADQETGVATRFDAELLKPFAERLDIDPVTFEPLPPAATTESPPETTSSDEPPPVE